MNDHLLIVEDDIHLNEMLALHFEDNGFLCTGVDSCSRALEQIHESHFDLVLLDQQLPDGLGVDLLPKLLEHSPDLPVVMMTGQHDLELAIKAIRLGAVDFVHKPIDTTSLENAIDKALRSRQQSTPVNPADRPDRALIGSSDAMLQVSKDIALCAGNHATVMITGESGTGKEVVARLIHQHSGATGRFVAVNCAAIVDTLLESELFGHEKGAFTGADKTKPGKFELASDGTLFLDEVAELAPALQAKLLRALQERVIEHVGGNQPITVSARIIAATHADLFERARDGRFREDLAYRLSVVNIQLPPLRGRTEDIPSLADFLLKKAASENGLQTSPLSTKVIAKLNAHDWPGNVRELENVLTQALIMSRGKAIQLEHVQFRNANTDRADAIDDAPNTDPLRSLEEVEAEHIQLVLNHTGGHKGRSCEILGISRPALDRKILKYKLHLP